MSRFDETGDWYDAHRVRKAREELTTDIDLTDDRAVLRRMGRLEVALEQLLEMLDKQDGDRR